MLVNRADCLLNPLASNRQLMVNDVLPMIRQYTPGPVVCLMDKNQSIMRRFSIDQRILLPDAPLASTELISDSVMSAWRDGWMCFSPYGRFTYVPASGAKPISVPRLGASRFHRTRSSDNSFLLIDYLPYAGEMLIRLLPELSDDMRWSTAARIPSPCGSHNHLHAVAMSENHFFRLGGDYTFSYEGHVVDLTAQTLHAIQLPFDMRSHWTNRAVKVDENVVEVWDGERRNPTLICDLRTQNAVRTARPRFEDMLVCSDFDCVAIGEHQAACMSFSSETGVSLVTCSVYDRRAAKISFTFNECNFEPSLPGIVVRSCEPVNF